MNKQEIETRLAEIKKNIEVKEDTIINYKSEIDELDCDLADLTLEESQLELQLAEIEEQEETKIVSLNDIKYQEFIKENPEILENEPAVKNGYIGELSDEKYGDFTGATEGDR